MILSLFRKDPNKDAADALYAAALDGRVADGPVVQALLLARALDLLPTPRDAH